jgi:catechol 2,3-dioxygenase-like lactoylglutathione lyase family enzyme
MRPKIAPWAFVLAVPDLEKSAAYYRDILGFAVRWEEASDWRLVERDGVRIMLGHCPNDAPPAELGSHNWFGYLEVDGVDALYAELAARGAACSSPKDAHYGMREIVVTTADGHRIVFAQEIGGNRR